MPTLSPWLLMQIRLKVTQLPQLATLFILCPSPPLSIAKIFAGTGLHLIVQSHLIRETPQEPARKASTTD
jgi:hypothetical protein